jgi:folate-binding Fe-S cluster repair protein YgfZ
MSTKSKLEELTKRTSSYFMFDDNELKNEDPTFLYTIFGDNSNNFIDEAAIETDKEYQKEKKRKLEMQALSQTQNANFNNIPVSIIPDPAVQVNARILFFNFS